MKNATEKKVKKSRTVKSSERPTQKKILEYLESIGAVTIKINNLAMFGKARMGTVRKEQKGCCDIIAGYMGLFIGIEVKSQTGYPSRDQKVFIDKCMDSGLVAYWVRDLEEVKSFISLIDDERFELAIRREFFQPNRRLRKEFVLYGSA